ncbi:TlyA family RNA methyltransferase [Spiractinospora alimapuensis]|uniref:TlyA family RNA methyltransferase n=1 Tax=Spiractinospora alimapuensis TaxID=2820884 RepID=UPI001F3F12FB|nr:TlyA family RNA methyltransferase [Spiractinospora alimapuensis]QVQ52113.1 TlyA family RNA methyltransferase [Spiractinospora alimapuensis]
MAQRRRLDVELVRRGFARSRGDADELINTGRVRVGGVVATKAARQVTGDESVAVSEAESEPTYVSRGAKKLLGALAAFDVTVEGRDALDAGASTGGFTDVLLRRGARRVLAVDVGYGQLAWSLRTDERVVVLERQNVRELSPDILPDPPADLVVADLSFISLRLVLPALRRVTAPEADFLLMVKPQFEVGRERVGSGGVVRDAETRADAVREVAAAAAAEGLGVAGVAASPLPGPSGNVEYFLWLRQDAAGLLEDVLSRAVAEGPQ